MKKEQFEEQVSEWDAETVGTAPNSYQCLYLIQRVGLMKLMLK